MEPTVLGDTSSSSPNGDEVAIHQPSDQTDSKLMDEQTGHHDVKQDTASSIPTKKKKKWYPPKEPKKKQRDEDNSDDDDYDSDDDNANDSQERSKNLHKWDSTCNLPNVLAFSKRTNAQITENRLMREWKQDHLFQMDSDELKEKKEEFILHDGPPFANGEIHLGHAYNKILKDMICKYKRMSGYSVRFVPGWDCHGLPIELKVQEDMTLHDTSPTTLQTTTTSTTSTTTNNNNNNTINDNDKVDSQKNVNPVELIQRCRSYAKKWIDTQREQFMRFGIIADWNQPYVTMDPSYEAEVLRIFSELSEKGIIERKLKTVPFCTKCKTVLASAEIDYSDALVPSCHVNFPSIPLPTSTLYNELSMKFPGISVGFLVWTTSVWSIPMNRSIVIKPKTSYSLVLLSHNKAVWVVSKQVSMVTDLLPNKEGVRVIMELTSEEVSENFPQARNPLSHKEDVGSIVPVIVSDIVSDTDGTGVLHMAPGCGLKDYSYGVKYGLSVYSPITPDGKYSQDLLFPKEAIGLDILGNGQDLIIDLLLKKEMLLVAPSLYRHSQPRCWRCNEIIMNRATLQWFMNLKESKISADVSDLSEPLGFFPKNSKSSFKNTVKNREDWCLSRQRHWGIPIPAIECSKCSTAIINACIINKVAEYVESQGIEFWSRLFQENSPIDKLLELGILKSNPKCSHCGNESLEMFHLGRDILDVWFVSGVSHVILDKQRFGSSRSIPDLFLEGRDQHRGWFSSSMITAVALHGEPCAKAFLTHGFVVNDNGDKISKSKYNAYNTFELSPNGITRGMGADSLRLWVAMTSYQADMKMSRDTIATVYRCYRNIRNSLRFLSGHLYDFHYDSHSVPFHAMHIIDQFAVSTLFNTWSKMDKAYKSLDFLTGVTIAINYLKNDIRKYYLPVIKDRCCFENKAGHLRRSAQTVCHLAVMVMTKALAPILSFLCEEVYEQFHCGSVHRTEFEALPNIWEVTFNENSGENKVNESVTLKNFVAQKFKQQSTLEKLRTNVLKELSKIGSGLRPSQAFVKITIDTRSEIYQILNSLGMTTDLLVEFLRGYLRLSQLEVVFTEVSPDTQNTEKLDTKESAKPPPAKAKKKDQTNVNSSEALNELIECKKAEGSECHRCWRVCTEVSEEALCTRCQQIIQQQQQQN